MRSLLFTSSNFAIWSIVCKSGWDFCEHHLLTVQVDFPNCSANHLLVRCFSAKTTLILFRSLILSIDKKLNFDAKLINFFYIISYFIPFLLDNSCFIRKKHLESWQKLVIFGSFARLTRQYKVEISSFKQAFLSLFSPQNPPLQMP